MIFHYLQGCFFSRRDDASIKKYFDKKYISFKIGYYKSDGRWIRYLETGDDTQPLVLFVHGAPGSSNAFLHFLSDGDLLNQAHMISVDRPGYGYSGFGSAVISLRRQAAIIHPLLEKNNSDKRPILVGHSYGGTIIARMAMDYPDEVGALVMAAPAVDPRLEKIFRISYPADWIIFRWLIPACLRVTNQEKLGHIPELNRMLPLWEKITTPVTVIHGAKDWIAPVENAAFLQKQLKQTSVRLIIRPDLDHLVPWEDPGSMKEAIKAYLQIS